MSLGERNQWVDAILVPQSRGQAGAILGRRPFSYLLEIPVLPGFTSNAKAHHGKSTYISDLQLWQLYHRPNLL